MEATDLTSADYWKSGGVDVRLNPKRVVDSDGLQQFLETECGIRSAVVLATSGSGGAVKFVVLLKSAILASARAVNAHCGLTQDDRWLGGLSTFHVGGLGIYARAFCNGAKVIPMEWDSWTRDGMTLVRAIEEARATVTSLTPVHLHDLVSAGTVAPESLRGVFLGGGRIEATLVKQARDLGWPIWATYGMSEAASQIATGNDGRIDWLSLLPIWECRTDGDGRLAIRGAALFSGYATKQEGRWAFDTARDEDGWYTTGDRCELRQGELRFLGRCDDLVKVSGELISLSRLNLRLAGCGCKGVIVAVPDPRRESELVLVLEEAGDDSLLRFNNGLPLIEQASRVVRVDQLPRTDAGKLDFVEIAVIAGASHFSQPTG